MITKRARRLDYLCRSNIRDAKLQIVAVEGSIGGGAGITRRNGSMSDKLKFRLIICEFRVTTCAPTCWSSMWERSAEMDQNTAQTNSLPLRELTKYL